MEFSHYYNKELLNLYRKTLAIRIVENEIQKRYPEQEMRCPVHLSIGQEVNAVMICEALTDKDYMVSGHRAHAHYLAKGGSINGLIGELYGKATGCSRGFGGSMHLVSEQHGFLGSTSIVGGTIPIGVGAAFKAKLNGENRVSVVCLGDGALEEGVFHESVNFARLHNLPVIFFCENNLYSCYTHIDDRKYQGRLNVPPVRYIELSREGFVKNTYRIKKEVEEIRLGAGPVFIHMPTYRFVEHCGPYEDDHLGYRPEHETRMRKDPLDIMTLEILQKNLMSTQEIMYIKRLLTIYISEIFNQVKTASYPEADELGRWTYA